jgi:hypothetical protein
LRCLIAQGLLYSLLFRCPVLRVLLSVTKMHTYHDTG